MRINTPFPIRLMHTKSFTLGRSTVFAGNAADLKTYFLEERIPDNWEPRVRSRHGFTVAHLNWLLFQIEYGISRMGNLEERVKKDGKRMCITKPGYHYNKSRD
ncbi:hypothetical protein FRC08_012772 [Ceratobasidium sp. 394]|nr:hypothetical protein FRC08_012772 [Ceratobasidium sp. 394]